MSARNWLGVAIVAALCFGYVALWVRSFGWRDTFGMLGLFAAFGAVCAAITWCFS